MNCFQFVIWRSLTHLVFAVLKTFVSCELLSICDLTIFDTPCCRKWFKRTKLWIAFNLWFDDLWHTTLLVWRYAPPVVNCFQFVIWRSLTHPQPPQEAQATCCELLSICDLTIFDTPSWGASFSQGELWIAFNLWFDDLWHTQNREYNWRQVVVNCFQFVIWRSLTHHQWPTTQKKLSCELLSICDLTIFDTPVPVHQDPGTRLWIAFNLWFDDLWHTKVRRLL